MGESRGFPAPYASRVGGIVKKIIIVKCEDSVDLEKFPYSYSPRPTHPTKLSL